MGSRKCKLLGDGPAATLRLPITYFAHKTTIVPDALVATVIALLNVATERGGSAELDRAHDAMLRRGQHRGMSLTIGFAVAAEHIRHFQPKAGHLCESQKCFGGVGFGSEIGRGRRSSGLEVEQTLLVAIRRYRAVVAKLRWPSKS